MNSSEGWGGEKEKQHDRHLWLIIIVNELSPQWTFTVHQLCWMCCLKECSAGQLPQCTVSFPLSASNPCLNMSTYVPYLFKASAGCITVLLKMSLLCTIHVREKKILRWFVNKFVSGNISEMCWCQVHYTGFWLNERQRFDSWGSRDQCICRSCADMTEGLLSSIHSWRNKKKLVFCYLR